MRICFFLKNWFQDEDNVKPLAIGIAFRSVSISPPTSIFSTPKISTW